MSTPYHDPADGPGPRDPRGAAWLTVAEIAGELRVNPATVRLWISKGMLPAKRAGQRKLLIRRSDLDYMVEVKTIQIPASLLELAISRARELGCTFSAQDPPAQQLQMAIGYLAACATLGQAARHEQGEPPT